MTRYSVDPQGWVRISYLNIKNRQVANWRLSESRRFDVWSISPDFFILCIVMWKALHFFFDMDCWLGCNAGGGPGSGAESGFASGSTPRSWLDFEPGTSFVAKPLYLDRSSMSAARYSSASLSGLNISWTVSVTSWQSSSSLEKCRSSGDDPLRSPFTRGLTEYWAKMPNVCDLLKFSVFSKTSWCRFVQLFALWENV